MRSGQATPTTSDFKGLLFHSCPKCRTGTMGLRDEPPEREVWCVNCGFTVSEGESATDVVTRLQWVAS